MICRKSTHLSFLSLLNKLRILDSLFQKVFAITLACSSSLLRSRSIYSRLITTKEVVILLYFVDSIIPTEKGESSEKRKDLLRGES